MHEDGSEAGIRGTFEIYRAEGDSLYKNGDYRKAIESFTTALELKEGDKDCLVARSRCHLQLGDAPEALKDAETSLEDEPNFHKGLYQKAEALYYQGEFELALMFYHRGRKLRPELQEFRLGIQKAQEAIDNSVGSPEKVKLTKEGDLSYFTEQANDSKQRGKAGGRSNRPSTRDQRRRKEPPKSASNDKTVKQLLGELYGDRIFLEKLLKETDPPKRHSKSGGERGIYDLITDGINYLDTRTDFWRQQKPMYARKRDRAQRQSDASGNKDAHNKYVIKELEKIDEEQSEGKFESSLKRARRCLKTVESYPDDAIQNKMEVIAQLHSCMGNAYLEMGDLSKAQKSHETDYEIGSKCNIEESKSRALDNLGRVYARQGKFKEAINCWEQKLPMVKSPLETTWLYHEIGRCNLEEGNYEKALEYGQKSVTAAEEANDDMWQLNATVLVAQSQVKLNQLEEALDSFQRALDMAKVQGDEAAEAAIKKAIDDVNAKIVRELKEEKEGGQDQEVVSHGKGSQGKDTSRSSKDGDKKDKDDEDDDKKKKKDKDDDDKKKRKDDSDDEDDKKKKKKDKDDDDDDDKKKKKKDKKDKDDDQTWYEELKEDIEEGWDDLTEDEKKKKKDKKDKKDKEDKKDDEKEEKREESPADNEVIEEEEREK